MEEDYPDAPNLKLERLVQSWSDLEVELEAAKRKLLIYQDETHIPRVVARILDNWEEQSKGRIFNGILTAKYKRRAIAYFKEFKDQLEERNEKLNIALTFSFGNENEEDEYVNPEIIEKMFKNYASFTGIEFVSGDQKRGEDAYFEDIVARGTRGGSGRNEKNIDLIIVANQLLTGYDSKFINTLYVDRELELQHLIQAYSRTNRIYNKDKEFGSVVNFQYPKITEELVKLALKLYGSGGTSSLAIVEDYDTAVKKLSIMMGDMIEALPDPSNWEDLKTKEKEKEYFIACFIDANKQLSTVMQYYEYKWDDDRFKLDEHTWLRYVGAFKNLTYEEREKQEELPIIELRGKTKIASTQIIDDKHILSLIGARIKKEKGVKTVDDETLRLIYEEIQELSDMGQAEEAKLLKEFVETELLTGQIKSELDFDQDFENWKQTKVEKETADFAKTWGIDRRILAKSLEQFEPSKKDIIPYIDELQASIDYSKAENQKAGNQLAHMMFLVNEEIPEYLTEMKKKYK